ncbi:hypothetical protein SPRG_05651 [Saprolegnia parasitica CBS 223.65]|uniref:Heterogeneous nuclear ribonucleoprotein Q acidic domain-containing protein n=1 Tax=Saprolegnia parasitica (strain CBS 223.65) TaxID=695850 RepID=A0A067CKK3_SAPPC|nr:hypothetical protein SPRG_05651 [Saprolegnia parasitica CBS 223.65]KDO29700.1 hypothetical protein SPRG_05651 [Saprolegnia parasitica CBS 223.65]|eukprot:XP_012199757.1 hypothetical protein SPRG_05651 [Saprolegnia parasitica CBS 223.65]
MDTTMEGSTGAAADSGFLPIGHVSEKRPLEETLVDGDELEEDDDDDFDDEKPVLHVAKKARLGDEESEVAPQEHDHGMGVVDEEAPAMVLDAVEPDDASCSTVSEAHEHVAEEDEDMQYDPEYYTQSTDALPAESPISIPDDDEPEVMETQSASEPNQMDDAAETAQMDDAPEPEQLHSTPDVVQVHDAPEDESMNEEAEAVQPHEAPEAEAVQVHAAPDEVHASPGALQVHAASEVEQADKASEAVEADEALEAVQVHEEPVQVDAQVDEPMDSVDSVSAADVVDVSMEGDDAPASTTADGVSDMLPLFADDADPAEMEPYDPDDYELPADESTNKAPIRAFPLPPCVHESVEAVLAEIRLTEPSVVFDERTLLAMNALTTLHAAEVIKRFQAVVAASAVPPDTYTALRDIIADVKAKKPSKKEPKPAPILADAVWARLLDCQADGASDFTLRDLRASSALDALGKLPAFAQLTVVSRFVKSSLSTIRSKDSHLTQLILTYHQENPLVASLRPVSEVDPSTGTDESLFEFGYAPPQPPQGMLSETPVRSFPLLDQIRAEKTSTPGDAKVSTTTGKSKLFASAARTSDMYPRLSPAMEDVYATSRMKDVVNDTVLLRLMKLPDHLALRAVENFRSTDTAHVDNINGFFVGIITRVMERERTTGPPQGRLDPRGFPAGDFSRPPSAFQPPTGAHLGAPMPWAHLPAFDQHIRTMPLSVQTELSHMVAAGVLASIDELAEKCYEILGQLSEPLALEVLNRYTTSNLDSVRNRSGFLIGVIKRCRQEYGLL